MEKHQEHFARKFYQDKKTGYWISTDYSKDIPRVRAHCWVWINIHGKIPKGYHIHHKNEDKSDNRIENLELIEMSRHLSLHSHDPVQLQRMREMAAKYRPLTKAWHASEEGKVWHRLHALKSGFGKNVEKDYKCLECRKDFKSFKGSNTKFCCNNCKSIWRRKSDIDDIEVKCERCLKLFVKNKYSRSRFCSRSCGNKKPYCHNK